MSVRLRLTTRKIKSRLIEMSVKRERRGRGRTEMLRSGKRERLGKRLRREKRPEKRGREKKRRRLIGRSVTKMEKKQQQKSKPAMPARMMLNSKGWSK